MGAMPPKKETGKVQPKKETVRINLPPKPSAAPTIKLPTLPPGGPTGAPSAAPPPSAPKSAPVASPSTLQRAASAPIAQQRPVPMAPRPAAAPTVGRFDKVLAIFAAIAAVAALAVTAYLVWMLPIGN
jgi:hypothetical protein